ncbi:MAG: hypothetical protein ACKPKO_60295, partial [Candidatus Fonsibacter sp.]
SNPCAQLAINIYISVNVHDHRRDVYMILKSLSRLVAYQTHYYKYHTMHNSQPDVQKLSTYDWTPQC